MTGVQRRVLTLAGIAAACAAGAALSHGGLGVPCLFRLVTGLECPGCGITRMLGALARGDVAAAFRANAALTVLLPVFAVLAVRIVPRWVRTGSMRTTRGENAALVCCVGILLAFGVVRNAPHLSRLLRLPLSLPHWLH